MLFLTGVGTGCLTILFMMVAREYGNLWVARVFLMLIAASCAFLLHPLVGPEWRWLTYCLQSLVPSLFWLLCQLAFAYRPRLVSVWSVLALYAVLAPNLARIVLDPASATASAHFFGWTLGAYFEYLVIGHGLWTVLSNWSDDLVSSRRHLRGVVLLVVGVSVSWAAVSLNFGLAGDYTRPLLVVIPSLITAYFLLKGHDNVVALSPAESCQRPDAEPPLNTEQARQLHHGIAKLTGVMSEGYYRTENLTLKRLAGRIGLPEYKTRAVINHGLGYRNFNDYINHLRIVEATERLIREPDTPIQNIALDIGYRSLSSFNRAFREIMDTTPTRFRQQSWPSGESAIDQNVKMNESTSIPE
ncbi:AraC family transcriptional regulator [Marinobacter sp. 71-i]|uniref:AraC family transcriptional regulator n=1 Tax=Marinobacter iranensis TaxID=2962607 RepID=A0ABT5Y4Y9_9GAMM|nr:AraC family transcriptional regulator [Marinobacter iranensis]MDF0748688.1 AraC family transcriptional regulator [Marinobacter iranensis]